MKLIIPQIGEKLLDLGKRCDAVYVCPKDGHVRKGPLVPYAGKDSQGRNFVGDMYFNFRRIEPHLKVVEEFAETVWLKLIDQKLLDSFETICGIPQGGRTFGQELARITGKRFVYADKKPKPTESGKKQEYTWDLLQFDFEPGERVAIAEDVYNNFQNTDNTLTQIAVTGVDVVLLVGALNRSPVHDTFYIPKEGPLSGHTLPVVTSIREVYPEYEQDDPAVIDDMKRGNIEWEVKKNWAHLCASMES